MQKMALEEYLDMVAEERINMLLSRPAPKEEKDIFRDVELAAAKLPLDVRETFDSCADMLMDMQAQEIRLAYLGGFEDGIQMAGCIEQISRKGQDKWKKWKKNFCSE